MRCFEAFPGGPGAVRAVLVGKAPYPNAQQAHGLALSAPDGAKKPPCVNTWLYNHLKSDRDCGFVVAGRLDKRENFVQTHAAIAGAPDAYRDMFLEIAHFRHDLSSTELRAKAAAEAARG